MDSTSSHRFQTFTQYFINGVSSTTLEIGLGSRLRRFGIAYIQWYNTSKKPFAAGNSYLSSNPTIVDLALDEPKLRIY